MIAQINTAGHSQGLVSRPRTSIPKVGKAAVGFFSGDCRSQRCVPFFSKANMFFWCFCLGSDIKFSVFWGGPCPLDPLISHILYPSRLRLFPRWVRPFFIINLTSILTGMSVGSVFTGQHPEKHLHTTRWPPTSYEQGCNSTCRGYNPSNSFIRPFIGVITPL